LVIAPPEIARCSRASLSSARATSFLGRPLLIAVRMICRMAMKDWAVRDL
jgi:hypothetical protein